MVKKELMELFHERCHDPRLNTSYPLSPSDWAQYRIASPLPFSEPYLSFYIHIPFCRHICSFCEYTRTVCPDREIQKHYISILRNDILAWISEHPHVELGGFDIGGGTPTSLDDDSFRDLMAIFTRVIGIVRTSSDFEPSIEATFQTLSEEKLNLISEAGIGRLSLGLQAASGSILKKVSREGISLEDALFTRRRIRESGVKKLNIDLMYGLDGKRIDDGLIDLKWIELLDPEQVTLYEFRPNMLTGRNYSDANDRYDQYCLLYDGLRSLGYLGEFGTNTFSIDSKDLGVSSYLRKRMCDGLAYKGFGISAQSMSSKGISYNLGKGRHSITGLLRSESYPEEYTYFLPKEELLAKYICISAYCGHFSMTIASSILNGDYYETQKDILDFLQEEKLVLVQGDQVRITRNGFVHYGAVFSLLYDLTLFK